MPPKDHLSRRTFVTGAVTSTAALLLPKSMQALTSEDPGSIQEKFAPDWREQGVIDLNRSRFAKMHTVPVRAVTLHEGFWQSRREINVSQSIPTMHDQLEIHGRMDNFRRLTGASSAPQRGKYYSDSDLYKWTEAASFAQQSDLEVFHDRVEAAIQLVQGVQEPNGYLNTYYVDDRAKLRMTPETQEVGHELYNIGHLIQGAVAQYRATGDTRLLVCCVRFVNEFLLPSYGPGKKPIVAGHPEIEMALVELYRVTGDPRHLELAGYILEGDPRVALTPDQITYMFCGVPFPSRTKLEGHAVRAMYACCGATDYYLETGDERYLKTLTTLWEDLVRDQMYVSGGVGARRKNEAFGDPYELPNTSAYGESCAAIGNMMWNWRMLHATGDARHADVIERALYNGINSGMSLSGTTYCYRNPLAFDPADGQPIRNAWYDTTCCPPNLERTFAALPGYMYSTSPEGLHIHLFHNSTLDWHLESGMPIKVEQQTEYPWNGRVAIKVSPAKTASFTIYVRIPAWAHGAVLTVAGQPAPQVNAGEYAAIQRLWKDGDVIELDLPMDPQMLTADHRIAEDQGKVAIQRGPLLYCAEGFDQTDVKAVRDLRMALDSNGGSSFQIVSQHDTLGGVTVLEHAGLNTESSGDSSKGPGLYEALTPALPKRTTISMIPYYAWANRDASTMAVWLPYERETSKDGNIVGKADKA